MAGFIAKLFGGSEGRDRARPLYAAIVAEARRPDWYVQGGVEDSVSGRYEALAMVFAAVAIRLEQLGEAAEQLSVLLTECFVEDVEGQLRQDGVGDVMVGKRVGTLVGGVGGRIGAYRDGLADRATLDEALVRNLYRGERPSADAIAFTQHQLIALHERLAERSLDRLAAGQL